MAKSYKNIIKYGKRKSPKERRKEIMMAPLINNTPLPKPLRYEDYDKSFKKWVEDDLYISYEGKELPTMTLFSNQRFSEYLQAWTFYDDNKNPILNFKTISRDINPQTGTLYGDIRNIPGERTYLIRRIRKIDKNGREYFEDYRMKQPFCVDIIYHLSICANKLEVINAFNEKINDKFKSINSYMTVNEHFIGMKLDNISDGSEYSIDDRQFYSQTYDIKVLAYIITEDSFVIEETPVLKFMGFEGEKSRKFVEIEEPPCYITENEYYNKPLKLNITLGVCDDKLKFNIDTDFTIEDGKMSNVKYIKWYVNDNEYDSIIGLELKEGDEIRISKLIRNNISEDVFINFEGYIPNIIFDKTKDNVEFEEDRTQFGEEINIG